MYINKLYTKTGGGNSTPTRQSQFELLRIVAMFLVLIVHADFFSLGLPTHLDIAQHPFVSFSRITVESLALVCVNVYILISGYFGIKPRRKSVVSFIFMIVFWRILMTAGAVSAYYLGISDTPISTSQIVKWCIPAYGDWFITSYILLMLVAPLLNTFIEKCTARQLWTYVILYTTFQWIFAWAVPIFSQFSSGYSVLSFIGLYIIGATIRKSTSESSHIPLLQFISKRPATVYLTVSLAAAAVAYMASQPFVHPLFTRYVVGRFCYYNGINVLVGSVAFFLIFKRLKFTSRLINHIAASAFAVYLFHMHPAAQGLYCFTSRYLYDNYSPGAYLLLITAFILAVFITAIAIDRLRILLWTRISARD